MLNNSRNRLNNQNQNGYKMELIHKGKWKGDILDKSLEMFMEKADPETLKDGIRYYRELKDWVYIIGLFGMLVVALAFGFLSGETTKIYQNSQTQLEAAIQGAANYVCNQHNDKFIAYTRTNAGAIIAYCQNGTYSIK